MKNFLLVFVCLFSINASAQRNVILIIGDDMGTDYCGFYENHQDTVNLPNLRKLLAKGVRFTNVTANPLCSPTRAGILTGRYSFRTGVSTSIGLDGKDKSLDTAEITIPKLLNIYSPGGIAKAHFGKWHLNTDSPSTNMIIPNQFGYDYFSGNFRAMVYDYYKWKKITNGVQTTVKNYATTETIDNAISWIKDQQASKPLFVCVAFNAPHEPWHLPPSNLHSYPNLSGTANDIAANPKNYYKAAMEAMDREIGRLFDTLQVYNRLDSTDIIFVGDNGNPREICQNPLDMFKSKGTIYQGGVNVPMIIAGPSVINPGRVSDALVNTVDIFASVLELFNDYTWRSDIPSNIPVDSKSIVPILKDTSNLIRPWAFTEIFNSKTASAGGKTVRNLTYKYLQFENGGKEFYNLIDDPYERKNLLDSFLTDTEITNYLTLCNQLSQITGNPADCNALLNLVPTITNELCHGDAIGTVELNVTGGIPAYTYLWADGNSSRIRKKLSAGRYPIRITDKRGQYICDTIVISEPPPLFLDADFTPSNCGGDVSLTLLGGLGPYSYNWSNGSSDAVLTNVRPATYIVTVTDANLCQIKDTLALVNNSILHTPTSTNVIYCFGEPSTVVNASTNGGQSPYSYLWSTGATTQAAAGLTPGIYTVIVTDSLGCKDSTLFNVSSNTALVIKPYFQKPTCSSDIGYIKATIKGGVSPYNYLWSNGSTDFPKIANLGAGIYSVTITDHIGCSVTASYEMIRNGNAPTKPGLISGPTHINCGETFVANYSTTAVANTLTYNWTVPNNAEIISGQGTRFITITFSTSFVSGNISVTALNYCGQSLTQTLQVSSIPAIPVTIVGPINVCANQMNVAYSIAPVADATNYLWTQPTSATLVSGQGTNNIVLNFKSYAGNLKVQAQNACGNSIDKKLFIAINCREQGDEIGINDLQVFPNPSHDVFNLSFNSEADNNYSISIKDVLGREVLKENKKAEADFNQTTFNLKNVSPGFYFMTFEMNGMYKIVKITVK